MKWRIVLALGGLVPAVLLALRDGRLSEDEKAELVDRLAEVLAGVLKP